MSTTTEHHTARQHGTGRDYRAEYRRRIADGRAYGLSRAQAAGHPGRFDLPTDLQVEVMSCVRLAMWRVRLASPGEQPLLLKTALLRELGNWRPRRAVR